MKILKIVLVLAVLGVILYFTYTKLIKKPTSAINDSDECKAMASTYNIVAGKSWGTATPEIMGKWTTQRCFQAPLIGPIVRPTPSGIISSDTIESLNNS